MNRLRNILACLAPVLLLAAGHARAAIVVWSDNFETNAPSRWYSTGVWKIGSPTAGPATNALGYHTYSGTNCASTQGYSPVSSGADVRLVCTNYIGTNTTLLVPPAGLSPRLRFEQWFQFVNAQAFIEVSTNNGTNWTSLSLTNGGFVPANQTYSGGGVWSRPSVDLSAYGGQKIQIAFHFSFGGTGNALGWFVDDVEVDAGPPVLNFPESFEAGGGDWSVDSGGWQIGKPTGGPGAAHTGTNCAATGLSGSYGNNVDSRLISPPFVVPSSGGPQLRFWQWYSLNQAFGWVEINNGSVNGSTTTNTTITTNVVSGFDTNIYQFSVSTIGGYTAPFYYNSAIGGWTNGTKVFGIVTDSNTTPYGKYFEAGNPPFVNYLSPASIPSDYRATNVAALTSVTNLQGATWIPLNGGNYVVGSFGTTNITTYKTNTGTVFSESSWIPISPTNGFATGSAISPGWPNWTNVSLDLSSYGGQEIEVAFHFVSGSLYTAPGWFVDDIFVTSQPQLNTLSNVTIVAGQTFSQELTATNPLLPNATYTFSSPSFPAPQITNNGPTEAVLTWTNTGIVDGALIWTNTFVTLNSYPVTYNLSVIAADNNTPPQTATNSFQLTIDAPPAPTLTVPSGAAIYAGETLSTTNYATNSIVPNAQYKYQLLSAPTNAAVDNNGVITWPTPFSQPTGPYSFIVQVTDNSQPPLSTNTSFVVMVTNIWMPTLTVPANQTLYAGQTMIVTNVATNSFQPGDTFNFGLISADLSGMDVSKLSTAGILTWVIPINQTAGVYTNVIQATDNNPPNYSVSGSFLVTVSNPPPPVLTLPPTQFIKAGQKLDITSISATNPVFPKSKYSFMVTNSPAGVSISKSTGELVWSTTPTNVLALATIYVIVDDDHVPPLSTSGSFLVAISPTPLSLGNKAIHTSGGGIAFTISPPITNTVWRILASTNLTSASSNWTPIYTNSISGNLIFTDLLATNYLQRYYRAVVP